MTETPGFFLYLLAFVLIIGPLVFVHELGHYAAGRYFGIKAEAFSIGFGREIAGFTDKRGTRWKFGWLPLGGYVKFAGDMNPAGQPSPEWLALPAAERAQTFQAKPLWQRAIVVAAGPVTNFIVAIAILGAFAALYGEARMPAVAGAIGAGTPAEAAGLKAGDRFVAIGGRQVDSFDDMIRFTTLRAGAEVQIDYVRDGVPGSTRAVIGRRVETDRFGNETSRGILGIAPSGEVERTPVAWWQAPMVGMQRTVALVGTMIDGLGQLFLGRVPVSELGGPLRIAKYSGETLSLGVDQFIVLAALISINLGFINLLPVPVLDGGHLLFYAIEAIRRKPVAPEVMEWAFRGGMMAILALMLLVTFNDLGAFGVWRSLAGLIG
ncbi:regulator of sigma E protease [Sphingomonas sp. BE123]|uniref:M50 family metallopeptidase n=1 Tax=Sphingomonas sp. BE123 TaxID=2817842 RepID=UPI002863F47E|nr:RIP metalloprotease [Sphingomonas sp. BE123]MDR6850907.1 regulator of sigma E protease [Sphingomonas sp. BE123]